MLKITLILLIFIALNNNGNAQSSDSNIQTYDSLLAKKYGADDYGMKQFIMAFLKSGKNILTDKAEEDRLQSEHMKNINKMAEDGKLVIAGPFMDNQSLKGIYIFDVRTLEEARELTSTDPAVKAGVLEMELHPWYGSAALLEINNIHNKIQKKSF
ncbi:MAG: YciI family protein [Ignavibacteria bacterium]|nr:hypothetical protein [Ignavibacteria bacterium]MBK8381860.1 hypothetical protein [Ignavibacteria bacterium]MBK9404857.1 hypothetical protein [Ignavibacteria bacterium]